MSLENSLKLLYPLNPISRYSSLILLMNKMATNRFVSSQICSLVNLPHRSTDSDEFLLPDFPEASTIQVNQLAYYLRVADGSDSISTVLQKVLPERTNADGILVNTIEELGKIGLMYFKSKFGRPVWPIGPVLRSTGCKAGAGKRTWNLRGVV
ncbi:hypothetical protein AB3S75_010639 [Citrus x aurantiifolia]